MITIQFFLIILATASIWAIVGFALGYKWGQIKTFKWIQEFQDGLDQMEEF